MCNGDDDDEDVGVELLSNTGLPCTVRFMTGRRVAELELHIALAQIVRNFRLVFPDSTPVRMKLRLFVIPDRAVKLAFIDT